ncbi:MAG: hypothetical protein ABFS03_00730 [Chloroflexota bacterium]
MTKTNQEADKGEGMSDVNKKAAEILVECGYAQKYEPYVACFRVVVYYTIKSCNPFLDTLEGRRQADAIENYLRDSESNLHECYLWSQSGCKRFDHGDNHHQWRLDRIKWCLEQLADELGDTHE